MDRIRGWFWTPARLKKLQAILDGAAEQDVKGFYFGPIGLSTYVVQHGKDLNVSTSQIGNGLEILVFLDILEPGKRGVKRPGYKRRYYPENATSITQANITKYRQRQHKG